MTKPTTLFRSVAKIRLMAMVLGLCCGINVESIAQQSINTPALTSVLPPAPNAFELTRYSGVPINLSTGSANLQIPMGEIKSGKISVAVGLNYSGGNGIKLNQIASRTGMNWTLSAGGLISRTVYDQPDEDSKWLVPPPNLESNSPPVYFYLDSATLKTTTYDTQSDIFNFEFNGYSGKFILKPTEKTKVIQLSPSPLRIETNFHNEFVGDWNIRITDPKGFVYYFGGTLATEKSKTVSEGTTCGKSYDSFIPSAWYLTKITHYNGEYVNFNYSALAFDYLADVSETLIRTPQSTLLSPQCSTGNCPDRIDNQVCASNLRSQGVRLTSITSNLNSVTISYISRTDIPGDYLISNIAFDKRNIADTTQSLNYNNYALSYVYSSNTAYYNAYGNGATLSTRPYLQQVARSASGVSPQYYQLKYLSINSLASRLSFAQDYWGYFNGKNNQHLVPTSNDPNIQTLFPAGLANREPDANYARFGLLSSITYPTGGIDSLQYESNTIYETRRPAIPRTYVNVNRQGIGDRTDNPYSYPFTIYDSQNVTFNLSVTYSGTGVNDGIHQNAILKVKTAAGLELYNSVIKIDSSSSRTLAMGGVGDYIVELHTYGEAALSNLSFSYQTQGPEVTTNYEAGGLRVLRNISIPNVGLPLIKRYNYGAMATPTVSSGLLRANPDPNHFYSDLVDGFNCPDGSISKCSYKIAYTHPINPLNYFSGNHIYYKDVIELKGDTWDNGGIAHHYLVSNIQEPPLVRGNYIPGVPLSNLGYNNGLEDLTKYFAYNGGANKIVQQTRTNYISDPRLYQQFNNYVVRRNWTPSTIYNPPNDMMFEPFDVAKFVLTANWVYADTITTITYDTNGTNPVETKQRYTYANTSHLQPTTIATTRSDNRVQEERLKYPSEMVQGGTSIPYQAMLDKNQITDVVVRESYVANTFKQSVTTNYQSFGANVIEPGNLQTRQDANTYTRIYFNAYDTMGNLLSQSKTGGINMSYQYGYWKNYPIAACSNALNTEFYSQNFEELGSATVGNAHTGIKYFAGDFNVTWAVPNARSYKISYWYLDGTWKYAEQAYTGPITLTAGTAIDDVNIYPQDAQMVTYTYDLLAGPSSIIDEKGETTYYTYDGFQRLLYIKDQHGNIIKSNTYHIKP